jgi:ribosomal-protein-alanine N-acetyltransferase
LQKLCPEGFFVAESYGSVVGYGIITIERGRIIHGGRRGHIMNLAVSQTVRRQGIGERLVRSLLSFSRKATAQDTYLEVRASNSAAISFYTKLGFEESGIIEDFYGNEDALVFSKRIR